MRKKTTDDHHILIEYFSKKAPEYETVYNFSNPVRLQEQGIIKEYIKKSFSNRYVLELACGTGYWTKYLLSVAQKIVATDASASMLQIASSRYATHAAINFLLGDAYNPPVSFPPFTGAMANFWFSHIPKRKIHTFLETVHNSLAPDAFVLFVDSNFRGEESGKLIRKKAHEDTWKRRKLHNGEEYDVLKNYFSEKELKNIFEKYSKNLEVKYLTNFWIAGYHLGK